MKSANDKSVVSSAENTNSPLHSRIYVPENNIMMFKIRFNLENEIKRIWKQNFSGIDERPKPRKSTNTVKKINEKANAFLNFIKYFYLKV